MDTPYWISYFMGHGMIFSLLQPDVQPDVWFSKELLKTGGVTLPSRLVQSLELSVHVFQGQAWVGELSFLPLPGFSDFCLLIILLRSVCFLCL